MKNLLKDSRPLNQRKGEGPPELLEVLPEIKEDIDENKIMNIPRITVPSRYEGGNPNTAYYSKLDLIQTNPNYRSGRHVVVNHDVPEYEMINQFDGVIAKNLLFYVQRDRRLNIPNYVTQLNDNVKSCFQKICRSNVMNNNYNVKNNLSNHYLYILSDNNVVLRRYAYSPKIRCDNVTRTVRVNSNIYSKFVPEYRKNLIESNDPNHPHDPLASTRRGVERCAYSVVLPKYNNYVLITFGHNLIRTDDIGGLHFLQGVDEYDKMRVNNYIENSCVPDHMILREKFELNNNVSQHITNKLNAYGIPNDHPKLVASTDAIYYNPTLIRDSFYNNTIAGISVHNHSFNAFHLDEGYYDIPNGRYHVEHNYVTIMQDGSYVIRDRVPNNNNLPVHENLDYMHYIDFVPNHIYKIPCVTMNVEGNPKPYYHPFAIIGGFIISIELLNYVDNLNNKFFSDTQSLNNQRRSSDSIIENIVKVNEDLWYVNVTTLKNDNSLHSTISLNQHIYEEIKVKDIRIIDQSDGLFDGTKLGELQVLKNPLTDTKDIVQLNGVVYELSTRYNIFSKALNTKHVTFRIPLNYFDRTVLCFRTSAHTLNDVTSVIKSIYTINLNEKWGLNLSQIHKMTLLAYSYFKTTNLISEQYIVQADEYDAKMRKRIEWELWWRKTLVYRWYKKMKFKSWMDILSVICLVLSICCFIYCANKGYRLVRRWYKINNRGFRRVRAAEYNSTEAVDLEDNYRIFLQGGYMLTHSYLNETYNFDLFPDNFYDLYKMVLQKQEPILTENQIENIVFDFFNLSETDRLIFELLNDERLKSYTRIEYDYNTTEFFDLDKYYDKIFEKYQDEPHLRFTFITQLDKLIFDEWPYYTSNDSTTYKYGVNKYTRMQRYRDTLNYIIKNVKSYYADFKNFTKTVEIGMESDTIYIVHTITKYYGYLLYEIFNTSNVFTDTVYYFNDLFYQYKNDQENFEFDSVLYDVDEKNYKEYYEFKFKCFKNTIGTIIKCISNIISKLYNIVVTFCFNVAFNVMGNFTVFTYDEIRYSPYSYQLNMCALVIIVCLYLVYQSTLFRIIYDLYVNTVLTLCVSTLVLYVLIVLSELQYTIVTISLLIIVFLIAYIMYTYVVGFLVNLSFECVSLIVNTVFAICVNYGLSYFYPEDFSIYYDIIAKILIIIFLILISNNSSSFLAIAIFIFLIVKSIPLSEERIVYEMGICSPNDTYAILGFIGALYFVSRFKIKYNNLVNYKNKYIQELHKKFNQFSYNKQKIYRLPDSIQCNYDPSGDREPLTNICFQVNGYNFRENKPVKMHHCSINELESMQRQMSCGNWYDEELAWDFIKFSQKYIDDMIREFSMTTGFSEIYLDQYYQKLGNKRSEYQEGYEDYINGFDVKLIYKMHSKTDEKCYKDPVEINTKARNICAQLPIGKVLMGIVCELGMQVIHSQPWCGPGSSLKDKGIKFSKFAKKLGVECSALCADGSAFDSTQYELFIKNIDGYFLKKIVDYNPYLSKIYNISDVVRVCEQSSFKIFSKKGFLYKIKGTQMSGRMNTCLSNTLRSALYVLYTMHKGKLNKDMYCFEVTGDDQIILGLLDHLKKYVECAKKYVYHNVKDNTIHGLGQVCKVFDIYEGITGAEYLSNYLLYNKITSNICLIRKPERFFQLIPYTFRNSFKKRSKFLLAKYSLANDICDSQLLYFKNIRIYSRFLLHWKKLINEGMQKILKDFRFTTKDKYTVKKMLEYNKKKTSYQHNENVPKEFNRVFEEFLFNKFNIFKEEITDFLECVEQATSIDDDINHELIDKLYKVDNYYTANNTECKIYVKPHYVLHDYNENLDNYELVLA